MAAKKKQSRLGWHFLPSDMRLGYGDGRKAQVGKTLSAPAGTTVSPCHGGMHASERPSQAAAFRKGLVLCRVEVSGEIVNDTDKFAGRSRKVLWAKKLAVKDVKDCMKAIGRSSSFSSEDDAVYAMRSVDYSGSPYTTKFDEWITSWAKKNGCDDRLPGKGGIVLEPASAKDVLDLLDYRKVVTKHEVKKALVGKRDLKPADSFYSDRVDELIDGDLLGRVHVIEDFTRHGGVGLLRINKK